MKKVHFLFLFLLGFLFFGTPKDIFAFTVTTTIEGYHEGVVFHTGSFDENSGLSGIYTISMGTESSPNLYTVENVSTDSTISLDNYDFETGSTIVFLEEFFFDEDTAGLGMHRTFITPGHFDTPLNCNGSFSDPSYSSEVTPIDVSVWVINPIDSDGIVTGDPYVSSVYYGGDGATEKTESIDRGTISYSCPTYCIHYYFQVRGNIAESNGTFYTTFDSDGEFSSESFSTIHVFDEVGQTVNGLSLSFLEDVYREAHSNSFSSVVYSYTDSHSNSDYTITVTNRNSGDTFEDALREENPNEFCLSLNVEARLENSNPTTGIIYRLLPFLILICAGGFGYYLVRRKQKVNE